MNEPESDGGVLTDIRDFLLRPPRVATLIRFPDPATRAEYTRRIAERMGIDVTRYAILNIHRIGIDAPVPVVFDELRAWSGEARYWPNHIATVESLDRENERAKILLFGRSSRWLRRRRVLPAEFGRIFDLAATKIQSGPGAPDDARYVLYRCSGGYPIGIFAMFVRSPIGEMGESEPAQLFFCVSFNFYGRRTGRFHSAIERVWEGIHNRATANILCRFKRRCEAKLCSRSESAAVPAESERCVAG
jgi:hypothetical protein